MRAGHGLIPTKYRYIEPYTQWLRGGRQTSTLPPARP
jgi:hypothetical protein